MTTTPDAAFSAETATMESDPWTWDIAAVQDFFRGDAIAYMKRRPGMQIPPTSFIETLAEKEVDGPSLMDMMTPSLLREEFGINGFRQRAAVMHCIEMLQRKSQGYHTRFDSPSPRTPHSLPPTPVVQPAIHAPPAEGVGENVRAGEQQTEDERGRKRRKLDLTKPQLSVTQQNQPDPDLGAFLPDAGMRVDEVFFGATPLGREVQELQPTGKVVVQDEDAEKAEYDFSFGYQPSSRGQSEYAFRRVRHFFHNDLQMVDVHRHNRKAVAIMPYPEKLALHARSALVIQARNETAQDYVSIRERASLAHVAGTDESPLDREDVNAYEEDILARWKHTPNEEIIGESDDDDDDDEADANSDKRSGGESEAEEVEEDGVSGSRVSEIIDAEVERIATEWQENKLPHLEKNKAWSVWKETKQSRTLRDRKIAEAQARVRHFSKRLSDQRQACEADEWASDEALRQVCRNLHATIEDRELLKWKIAVWQRRKEPVRTVNHGAADPARRERHNVAATRLSGGFAVHPEDRMSVEPTTPNHVYATATPVQAEDGDDEMEEGASGDENENFVTPEGSSLPDDFSASGRHMAAGEALTSSPPTLTNTFSDRESYGPGTQDLRQIVNGQSSDIESQSEAPLSPLQSFLKPKPSQGTPATSATPSRASRPGGISTQPITILSSDAEPTDRPSSPEPDLRKRKKGKAKAGSRQSANNTPKRDLKTRFSSEPDHATGDDVDSWNLRTLMEHNDRQRTLIKLLKDAGPERRRGLQNSLLAIGLPPSRLKELQSAIRAINSDDPADANDMAADTGNDMGWCARLAMAWYLPAGSHGGESLPWAGLAMDQEQLRVFLVSLNRYLTQKGDKLFQNKPKPSEQDIVPISSDDEEEDQHLKDTPRKKRKRVVKQSHSALMARDRARARHDQFTQQVDSQEAISSQIEARAASGATHSTFRINPHYKRTDDDHDDIAPPPIYINRKIAQHMKPHQVEGVRFMWREITAAGEEGGQGCLLAHTMGLGKTMQSIALLAAIVEASESPDRAIRMQLPANLRPREVSNNKRQLRLMILCPPSLITNWRNEIVKWAGSALGNIFVVEAASKAKQKQELNDWYRVGGLLIIGNGVFRNCFKAKKNEDEATSAARIAQNQELLLQGPEVVVADEVHNYKNADAAISKAVNRIETHTRIGLTGTPMSNDVSEIYSLVNWVAPDFLGDPVEFRAKFQEPIENGMYGDSTRGEIRKSIMKLKVLHHEIQPKVHRADITVLKGSLKPKTEFVITVPLTEVQTEAYKRYVDVLVGGGRNEKVSQVAIFGWLAVLMLLTNHPSAFMQKLLTPPAAKKAKGKKSIEEEGGVSRDPSPGNAAVSREVAMEQGIDPEALRAFGDEDVRTLGFSEEQIQRIIGDMEDSLDPSLSAKVSILMEILRLSEECGDQVLLFSHSIPTLNFLEQLFINRRIKHGRLDGTCKMKDRLPLIDSFNAKDFNVLLISTRAGGTGLNIQGANRVVIFDFSFNPSWELQAVGRAYRFGQQKPVFVYRFVAGGTFETNLYNKQMFKTGLANRVVDKRNTRRNAQKDTKEYLYPPKAVPQGNLLQETGKDPKVLDKLLLKHGPGEPDKVDTLIRSIETMEVLQQESEDAPLDEEEQRQVNEEIEAAKMMARGTGGGRRKTADALSGPASTAPSMSAARGAVHARGMMPPPAPHGLPSMPVSLPNATASGGQYLSRPPSTAPPPARPALGPYQNIPNGLPFIPPSSSDQSGCPQGQ